MLQLIPIQTSMQLTYAAATSLPYLSSIHNGACCCAHSFSPHWHIIKVTQDECSRAGQISHKRSVAHKKKHIKCPTCKTCLFQYDGTPHFSSVWVKYEIVLIHHSPCPSAIGNCGKGLFFCLSCGGRSSHTFGRLQDRGCKCVGVNNNKAKKYLNQQILTNDSAANNNDDVRYLGDSGKEPHRG